MPKKSLLTERDGRELAIRMLRAFESKRVQESDVCCIRANCRNEGTAQRNLAQPYIAAISTNGIPDVITGFGAVLTDILATVADGACWSASQYAQLTERDITGKPGPWPTVDDEDGIEDARADSKFQDLLQRVTG